MELTEPYIAFSHRFDTDYPFVVALSDALASQGLATWYLQRLDEPADITNLQFLGGDFDWRRLPRNWHATFLEHLAGANGVLIVMSSQAEHSHSTVGRGMWRGRAAIDFIRDDNPLRVRKIVNAMNGSAHDIPAAMLDELAVWGRQVSPCPQSSVRL